VARWSLAAAFSASNALSALDHALVRIVKCIFARFVTHGRPTTILWLERIFGALALVVTASFVVRGPPLLVALR
jgi:hypothetical protein